MQITGIRHKTLVTADRTSRRTVERWLRKGSVSSVQPWYITPEAPPDVVALLRLGVRPTCLDAASLHGLWTPPHTGTHVYRPRLIDPGPELEEARIIPVRRRNGKIAPQGTLQPVILHGSAMRRWPDHDPVPDLELVLAHAGRCLPTVKAAVLFESALHLGVLRRREVDRIVAALPQRTRRPLSRIRADAESGTETTVRWWLESRGFPVRSQVYFPDGRRRMDLLVGKSWVIECDSREFHDDPLSYDQDRERDLSLTVRGYLVTRLSWEQVFLRWNDTEQMLLAILRRGEHRRPPVAGQVPTGTESIRDPDILRA
ncbi:hypothetical protein [Brachybacterium sp. FME24]|uniref:hypothetical protein n=1 Tax=Brachybacterium sp. FME24 TaxID=2742605 RepID=UPI001D02E5CD|nr:hypothetical protein [Brachybacterium sp. FME24]